MFVWEHFNDSFNFDATPLGPLGFRVVIHNRPGRRKSWDLCGHKGFNVSPALNPHCYLHVVDGVIKEPRYSNTVKFLDNYLTQLTVTKEDHIFHC